MKKILIAGIDEAGRGPLAGPVYAAAVILDPDQPIEGLKDSKMLSQKKREQLAANIIEQSLAYGIGFATVQEIDEINILQASLLAMQRAVAALPIEPQRALVDGNQVPLLSCPTQAIVRGDQTVQEISAASILAKVSRDQLMVELDGKYPQYGLAKHKGYGTAEHMEKLKQYGPCPIHRYSFAPVRRARRQRSYETVN